jgi:hypothetical protein
MKNSLPPLLLLASLAMLPAGEVPAPPVPSAAVPEGWGNEVTLGYDSHYIFRGEALAQNVSWAQWSLDVPLTEATSLNLNPWYYQYLNTDFNEYDLNLTLSHSLETYELSIAYNGFYYPRGGFGMGQGLGDEQEFALSVAHDLFSLKATALASYNLGRDGYYVELQLQQPYEINDTFSVELGVSTGFDSGYFAPGLGINHVQAMLTLPIKLSSAVTLQPYLAGNFPMGHLDDDEARFYGGVQLGVSF